MRRSYWFYLRNIFINPAKAASAVREDGETGRVAVCSFPPGSLVDWRSGCCYTSAGSRVSPIRRAGERMSPGGLRGLQIR